MDLKQPLTYEEQLNRLEEHGLIIDADKTEYYKEILEKVNYYRFTGYAYNFVLVKMKVILFLEQLLNKYMKYIYLTKNFGIY